MLLNKLQMGTCSSLIRSNNCKELLICSYPNKVTLNIKEKNSQEPSQKTLELILTKPILSESSLIPFYSNNM